MISRLLSACWRAFCNMLGNQPRLSHYLLPLLQLIRPGYLPDTFRARVQSKLWQTPDILQLTLSVSTRWPGFIPGQHLLLTLQHNGRYISRPFSISSSIGQWQSTATISLCCKVSAEGAFTPQLNQLHTGDIVNISAAQGDFHWQHPAKHSVFIAAGSGITPVAAMLFSQRHWLAPATLYYRCRGKENAALLPELQQLAAQQPLFSLQFSDSRIEDMAQFQQRLTDAAAHSDYYLCGPAAFMQQLRQQLQQGGVEQQQIWQEQFGAAPPTPTDATDAERISASFIVAGQPHQFDVNTQQSLLQNAEQQGLSLRYGCRMGVCLQCVCTKLSGQVRDLRSGLLSGHGTEQIQLCISQAVTPLQIKL